jgi:hypothetical protein
LKEEDNFFVYTQIFVSTGLKINKLIATLVQHGPITFPTNFRRNGNNETPEHRTEEAPKALFWKSA